MATTIPQVIITGLEARLPSLRAAEVSATMPARGWLRAIRSATGIAQKTIAGRMGTTRQNLIALEKAEERGSITLNSARRAAEAMDCEFIYFLVPREAVARTYSDLARQHDPNFEMLSATEHSMALEDQAIGDLKPRQK